jgi:hypothetical protein
VLYGKLVTVCDKGLNQSWLRTSHSESNSLTTLPEDFTLNGGMSHYRQISSIF